MKGSAYIMVVAGILFAKCLGFLRDIVFASCFGASEYTDIYFQVFGIASLIFTGIGGALSTLVIKNLNKPEISNEKSQKEYVAQFITKTSFIVILAIAVMYLLSDVLVELLLPGLGEHMHHVAKEIFCIMLPSCLFVVVAYIMSGALQNSGVFFVTSVMSLPYNAIIIASLFVPSIDIFTVSIITTVGWFLHVAILLPSFIKKGFRLYQGKKVSFGKEKANKEALYIFISAMMFQLVFVIDKASVSSVSGAASTINYASNLFVTIASVFVVAMSNVSYPSICRHFEHGNTEMVRKILGHIIIVLLAIFIPFILTVTCFGKDIITLLYQRGEFTAKMSTETALLFAIYTFGIFGYVCQELLNKILYLDSKYRYTVAGTILVVFLKPFVNFFICKGSAYMVAASTTVMFFIYAICILWAISKSIGNYFSKNLLINIAKIVFSALVAYLSFVITDDIALPFKDTSIGFLPRLLICAFVYVASILVTGCAKHIITGQKNTLNQE